MFYTILGSLNVILALSMAYADSYPAALFSLNIGLFIILLGEIRGR